jgi:sulfatase maturation enzyme AslB (radical SAM superfamily)
MDFHQHLMDLDTNVLAKLGANKMLPTRVNAQISRRCNLQCKMCGWHVWQRNKGTMPEHIFDRVLDEMTANHVPDLGFSGAQGEPLLCPDAGKYIFKALDAGLSVEVNTNCTTLGDRNIAMMAEAAKTGNFRVQASFSGYDKQSHESVYVGSDFELTSGKVKKLFDAFAAIGALSHLAFKGIVLDGSPVKKHTGYLAHIGVDVDACAYGLFHGADNFGGLVPFSARQETCVLPEFHLCSIMAHFLIVYDDGKVSACACRDSEGVMEIGDIMTEGFVEMRNGERFQKMVDAFMRRDLSEMPLCRDCDLCYG